MSRYSPVYARTLRCTSCWDGNKQHIQTSLRFELVFPEIRLEAKRHTDRRPRHRNRFHQTPCTHTRLHALQTQKYVTSVSESLSAPCFSNNNEKYFHAPDFAASCFFNVNNSGLFLKRFSISPALVILSILPLHGLYSVSTRSIQYKRPRSAHSY